MSEAAQRLARMGIASLLLVACAAPSFDGVDVSSGQSLQLSQGRMSPGHTFSGTFLSPQSGRMTLKQSGAELDGDYEYWLCGCPVLGHLHGTVQGNLAQIQFREHVASCGEPQELAGHGHLFYRAIPLSDSPAQLFGARAYLAPPPFGVSNGEREDRPSVAWTAVELDQISAATANDDVGRHCP